MIPSVDAGQRVAGTVPPAAPVARWLQDVARLLPIRSQFVLSGNIRDSFLSEVAGSVAMVPLLRALWQRLQPFGYRVLLVFDPVDGIRVYPDDGPNRELAERLFALTLVQGAQLLSLESLVQLMKKLVAEREVRCALVIDFASRIARNVAHPGEAEQRFFVAAEKLSLSAAPVVPVAGGVPLFNPVLWLLNRAQDLPSWFALDSERVATSSIGKPDFEMRQALAWQLAPLFAGFEQASEVQRARFVKKFTEGSEGMSLSALADITELAERQGFDIRGIDDALRCYQIGVADNPWRKDYLRQRIRDAQQFIEERVKGQRPAIIKTLDIVKRSVMGLTGAQARSGAARPRGVLFFAGPTGVGKTELAKTLTQLVFGDERAYLRFDMSEFAEEHTSARLLGAPPGYVGFDAGGELTNRVREKPFSVVLFDEIEKAHPRIMDKFLQILEDGRLTDGRGDTAYFSETILVFTSNLGIFVEDAQGNRVQNVKPGDDYPLLETRVKQAIGEHFTFRLARPELLNRIGDNIVVFNFIAPEVAEQIFDGMLQNVARRLQEENRLRLSMPRPVRDELLKRCTGELEHGGRGIGNRLESCFINPLARALFDLDLDGRQGIAITGLQEQDKVISLQVQLL